ncbi:MAG TPA: uroporphyrinogen-III synthase [Arcobacter sp.]|nr:uroporphyrinogen-III synthase [Arcobacter sp.]
MSKDIYLLSNIKNLDFDIKSLNIFDINFLEYDIDFNSYDALIFTSKNAIYSINHDTSWKNISSYAISKKTAQILKESSSNLQFTGISGHGDDFAKELIPILKNKKVLYIRAKKVVSNLHKILNKNNILCEELVTYETTCINYNVDKKPNKNSIIIFSSPSTIECFLSNFTWDDSYLAIVIGKTTAKYLPLNINYKISQETSLESCIKMAKSFSIN